MNDFVVSGWNVSRISRNYFIVQKAKYYRMVVYCDNLYNVEIISCYNIVYRPGEQMIGDGKNHIKIMTTLYQVLNTLIVPYMRQHDLMKPNAGATIIDGWHMSKIKSDRIVMHNGRYIVAAYVDLEGPMVKIISIDKLEPRIVTPYTEKQHPTFYHTMQIEVEELVKTLISDGWFDGAAQNEQKEEESMMCGKLVSVNFTNARNLTVRMKEDQMYTDTPFGAGYYYQNPLNLDLQPEDIVIVETRYGLSLACVVEINVSKAQVMSNMQNNHITKLKSIVAKGDLTEWNAFQKSEERKKEIMEEVKQAKAKMADIQLLETMVQMMPEMQPLLDEYRALTNAKSE